MPPAPLTYLLRCTIGLLFLLSVSACTPVQVTQEPLNILPQSTWTESTDASSGDDNRLKNEDLYHLLAAEFALQRANTEQAAEFYRAAAQSLPDDEVFNRSTTLALAHNDLGTFVNLSEAWYKHSPNSPDAAVAHLKAHIIRLQFLDAIALASQWVGTESSLPASRSSKVHNTERYFSYIANALLKTNGLLNKESPEGEQLRKLTAQFPNSKSIRLALASFYVASHQAEAATSALAPLRPIDPRDIETRNVELALSLQIAPINEVIDQYSQHLKQFPNDLMARDSYANYLFTQQHPEAIVQYRYLTERISHNSLYHLSLGISLLREKDFEAAADIFKQQLALNQDVNNAHFFLALSYSGLNDMQNALTHFAQVKRDNSFATTNQFLHATTIQLVYYTQQNRFKAAQKLAAQSSQTYPDLANAIYANWMTETTPIASHKTLLKIVDAAIEQVENPYEFFLIKAELLYHADKRAQSIRVYRQLVKKYPEDALALNNLSFQIVENDQSPKALQEALTLAHRAQAIAPNKPELLDTLGWIYFLQNDIDRAISHLEKAYAQGKTPIIGLHLAEAYWQKGDRVTAEKILRDCQPFLMDTRSPQHKQFEHQWKALFKRLAINL